VLSVGAGAEMGEEPTVAADTGADAATSVRSGR
jgi:hypothetical protein